MLAVALACDPALLIADEPTTALDVTVQARILELINEVQEEFGLSVMMISHDLAVIAQTCDWLNVMYSGEVVEHGRTSDLFSAPKHPYSAGLLPRHPSARASAASDRDRRTGASRWSPSAGLLFRSTVRSR